MERSDFTVPLRLLLVSLVVFGLLYQGSLAAIGALVFPNHATGSPVHANGQVVGSAGIGQEFSPHNASDAGYFWSRPSSIHYDAMRSASANLGPTNPALSERVRGDLRAISQYETPNGSVPGDLVAESGSAYDAEISPAAANYQVPRVANRTGIPPAQLHDMIDRATSQPWLGVWGHEGVNVLELNIMVRNELDAQNATDQNSNMNTSDREIGEHQ
jgi:K+-transporting ATPase ATPase C chain